MGKRLFSTKEYPAYRVVIMDDNGRDEMIYKRTRKEAEKLFDEQVAEDSYVAIEKRITELDGSPNYDVTDSYCPTEFNTED